jgi:uncharacterized protein YndB with AHSA1/START domain
LRSASPERSPTYRETNVFTEVDRPRRIVFDLIMAMGEEGRERGGQDFSTKVTVTFEERDGKKLLTIVETGFVNDNDRDGSVEDGWPRILDALERVVAERRST